MQDDTTYNRFNSIKTLYYSDRIKQIVDGIFPSPVIWHVYPTNACTHDCSFCIMKADRENLAQLPKETLLKAVRAAKVFGSEAIHFSGGGEPLLHPDILEAVKEAEGLTRIMSTNGSLLSNEIVKNLDSVRISINAGSKESHAKIMRADTWGKIWKNIDSIDDKGKLGLAFVVTQDNWHEVYSFCELAARHNVNFVHIRPGYIPEYDDRIQSLLPAVKGLTDQAKKDFPNLNIYSVNDKFDGYWTERKYEKCLATPLNAVLKANGRFIPCQDRLDKEFGDLNTQSFAEIWGSQEHKETLASINCDDCPRCVMNKANEYIQNIFIDNNVMRELI